MGTAPRNIAVMGQHWCGHAEVARFVAEALDYDFAETGFVAASVYGALPHDFGADGWRRDRREVARTYSLDAELGHSRVWAADIWEDTDSLEIALGRTRLPFVVYLRRPIGRSSTPRRCARTATTRHVGSWWPRLRPAQGARGGEASVTAPGAGPNVTTVIGWYVHHVGSGHGARFLATAQYGPDQAPGHRLPSPTSVTSGRCRWR